MPTIPDPVLTPRGLWYALAALPGIVAIVIIVTVVGGIWDEIERMPRVVVPGAHDVVLEAGHHIIFGETQSVVDGVTYVASAFSVRCQLEDIETHVPVVLSPPTGSMRYTVGDHTGKSLFELDVSRAGRYRLGCESRDAKVVLAIGRGAGLVTTIVAIVAVVFGSLVLTGAIVWWIYRGRMRSRLRGQ